MCVCVREREREIQMKKYQEKKVIKRLNLQAYFNFYLENRIHFKHNAWYRRRLEHSRDDWVGVKPSRRKLAIHLFHRSGSLTASENLIKRENKAYPHSSLMNSSCECNDTYITFVNVMQ